MPVELTIVTPEGEAFDAPVDTVVLPGSEGDFGVLPGHERFLAPLRTGELTLREGGAARHAAVSGGFADVSSERVVVMAETCEFAAEIDEGRAEEARRRAQADVERLGRAENEEQAYLLAQAALERALVRLQVARRR